MQSYNEYGVKMQQKIKSNKSTCTYEKYTALIKLQPPLQIAMYVRMEHFVITAIYSMYLCDKSIDET